MLSYFLPSKENCLALFEQKGGVPQRESHGGLMGRKAQAEPRTAAVVGKARLVETSDGTGNQQNKKQVNIAARN